MKRYIAEIGGKMFAAFEQSFLLLRDAIEAAIIVNHHGDRQTFLKSAFDGKATGEERPIAVPLIETAAEQAEREAASVSGMERS